MRDWLTNPTILIVGAVGVFAAIILLRNQQSSSTPTTSGTVTSLGESASTTPVGQSYQYLDGNGMQHIIATDPNGNLVGYNSLPPGTSMPQTGQMASYVGSMSGQYLVPPYGGSTPYYSMSNTMPWWTYGSPSVN